MAEVLGPDIALNPTTGDLQFTDGDLVLETDLPQAITIQLSTFLGEWFLDPSIGVPFLTQIFGKQVNLELIRSIFRDQTLKVAGVDEVNSIILNFDAIPRDLSVALAITSDESEISLVVEVPI